MKERSKELHTFAKMCHASIKVNFVSLDELYKNLMSSQGITHIGEDEHQDEPVDFYKPM